MSKTISKTETNTAADVTDPSPKPQRKALLYCRVSSTKQKTHGHGLDSQELRCRQYANDQGYEMAGVFPDDASGGGDFMARPGMVALLRYLDANPLEQFVVIFDDLKRFARDTAFHLKLREALTLRGASVECLNFKFEDTPEGRFIETILAAQGELERRQNRRQVIQKMRARTMAGYYCQRHPVGYVYQKQAEHGRILTPKEPEASIIREALEGYACGRFETAAEVARFLGGYPSIVKTRTGSVRRQMATDILKRPIYAGYIHYPNWGVEMLKGKHEALISLEIWHAIQERLEGRKNITARSDIREDFPLRNYVACAHCGNAYTSSWSKGRSRHYGYYTCQTDGCTFKNKSIRKESIEGDFAALIRRMQPAPALFRAAKAMFADIWNARASNETIRRQELRQELSGIERKISNLVERVIGTQSDALITAYEGEIKKLELRKAVLTEQSQTALKPLKSFDQAFGTAMEFLGKPWRIWEQGSFAQRRVLLRLALPNALQYDKEHGFSNHDLALPFKALEDLCTQNLGLVPRRGLEPPRPYGHQHLKLARLPIPPPGQVERSG